MLPRSGISRRTCLQSLNLGLTNLHQYLPKVLLDTLLLWDGSHGRGIDFARLDGAGAQLRLPDISLHCSSPDECAILATVRTRSPDMWETTTLSLIKLS